MQSRTMDELYKLDLKDKRILYELDSNARQSCSQIGKKVGLPTEVVNYRLKRLEQENLITHYQAVLNLSKLGIIQFKICLKVQHLDSDKFKIIIKSLVKHRKVMWVASCKGGWDVIISLEADSLQEVESLKNEILSLFENYIYEKGISVAVNASAYNRNYLLNKNTLAEKKNILGKYTKCDLDKTDISILKQLSDNSRKSVVNIASDLKSTPKIVTYRINQLQKKGIITGFRIALNYPKLGIEFYKLFIYLDNPQAKKLVELENFLESKNNLIHNVNVIGAWDFEPEFEVYSEDEINRIIMELKDKFPDIIKRMDVITITDEHKFVYFT